MGNLVPEIELEEFLSVKHATLFWVKSHPTFGLIQAQTSYIPIMEFKMIFNHVESLISAKKITKIIFDKRSLKVFHQPSMDWYFAEWKEKMAPLGLVDHVKILPKDEVFYQSVKIGREQIDKKYPHAKFHELSIIYANSIEEALL